MVAHTSAFAPRTSRLSLTVSRMDSWNSLFSNYETLAKRSINNVEELEVWLLEANHLTAIAEESFAWLYIHFTTDLANKSAAKQYEEYIQLVSPRIEQYQFDLHQQLTQSPYLTQLPDDYTIHLQLLQNKVKLYQKNNVPLRTQEQLLGKQYGSLLSKIAIEFDGITYPLQVCGRLLENKNASKRQEVYQLINAAFLEQKDQFEQLFDELRTIRFQIATQAHFKDYRAYKFQQLARFDYTAEDCLNFHDAIKAEVIPLLTKVHERKCKQLNVSKLQLWDVSATAPKDEPLHPVASEQELIHKTINILSDIDPFFGACLNKMYVQRHLDLETRANKRPGGYQMPLPIAGVPFIFMNTSQSIQDLRTFMHESGHAIHSFSTNDLPLMSSKHPPIEIAELAAMTMELLSMDKWQLFFEDEKTLCRAQIWLLENILQLLPWIAVIDRFQHWIYTHPKHTIAERETYWLSLVHDFKTPIMDYENQDDALLCAWYRQLHLFEAPFYYIEYGMAQLGAIAIWKNYREKGQSAVEAYKAALALGYTKSIKEVYATAGIQFDFSATYLRELVVFLEEELTQLWAVVDA